MRGACVFLLPSPRWCFWKEVNIECKICHTIHWCQLEQKIAIWRGRGYSCYSSGRWKIFKCICFVDCKNIEHYFIWILFHISRDHYENLSITDIFTGEQIDGEFDCVVNDGKYRTDPVTFRVKIHSPVLNLVKHDFQIFPMLHKAITPSHLLTWCSDTSKDILYVVKTPPKYGILTTGDTDSLVSISRFTQADVNASKIWYQHTSHVVDADTSHDSFRFDVIAKYAKPILNQV